MIKFALNPIFYAFLFAISVSFAGQVQNSKEYLLSALDAHDVVILGEIHRHRESEELAYEIVEGRIKAGKPLILALEITFDQNHLIESGNVGKIKLPYELEFKGYRDFLDKLTKLQRTTDLLEVKAIDMALNQTRKRDTWMADQVTSLLKQNHSPILILVGNYHGIKHVDWNHIDSDSFLAEILIFNKADVFVIMQDWIEDSCNGQMQPKVYPVNSPKANQTIAKFLSHMNVNVQKMPKEKVADAVIQWECKQ